MPLRNPLRITITIGSPGAEEVLTVIDGEDDMPQNWQLRSNDYTAQNRDRVIADVTAAGFELKLPPGARYGDEVEVLIDGTNPLTINPNGAKVNGAVAPLAVTSDRAKLEIVYKDDARGWLVGAGSTAGTGGGGTEPTPTPTPTPTPSSLLTGLSAFWKLGDLKDEANNSNLINSGVTFANGEASFNGSSFLYTPNAVGLQASTELTIAFMAKIAPSGYCALFSKWESNGTKTDYLIDFYGTTVQLNIAKSDNSAGTTIAASVGTLDNYHLIVAKITPNSISLRVDNGTPVTSQITASCRVTDCDLTLGSFGGTRDHKVSAGTLYKFAGVWKRVLTDEEETKLWNNGSGLEHPFS
ncbi:hypothetical protein NDA01_03550 [Trichocoleus desertorum AS-A10]|uniref:hypothetical protein n=1 Tax=Trichocoleus desertorum TaxID=1481672 RepID=UPI003297E1E1